MALSPLFDIYDPQGLRRDGLDLGIPETEEEILGIVPLRKRQPQVADLLPEDEKTTLLRQLANAGASGLSGFGWLLDTPGAMVRGLLSEGPGKALSALWEDSEQRITGRELARQYGLAGSEDNWGNFSGGLLAELALDPLTYLSFGAAPLLGGVAKTAAGKAAQRSAMLTGDLGLYAKKAVDSGLRPQGYGRMALQRETPEAFLDLVRNIDPARADELLTNFRSVAGDQADDLLKQRMSATNRVSIPGVYDGAFDLWDNVTPGAGDRITRTADWIGQAAQRTPILGDALRNARGLFWGPAKGLVKEADQWRGRAVSEAERLGEMSADRWLGETMPLVADQVGMEQFQKSDFRRQFSDAFGLAMENQRGTEAWGSLPEEIRNLFDGGGGSMLVDSARQFQNEAVRRARELGLPLQETHLPFDIGYLTRQKTFPDNPKMAPGYEAATARNLNAGTELFNLPGEAGRKDWTMPFPRWVLNKMAGDAELQQSLRQFSPQADPQRVMEFVDGWLKTNTPDYWSRTVSDKGAGPYSYLLNGVEAGTPEATQALEKARDLYGELADSMASLPTNYASEKLPFYGDALSDFVSYVRSRGRTEKVGPTLIDELAKVAVNAPRTPSFSSYTAREALEKFGLDLKAGEVVDDSGDIIERSNAEKLFEAALQRSRPRNAADPIADIREGMRLGIDNIRIPQDLVENLLQGVQRARVPGEAKGLLKKYDEFLESFKALALLWPARYTRDSYSGSFAAATQGLFNPLDSYAGLQAGRGNYQPLARRLGPGLFRKAAPGYEDLSEDERVLKWLSEAAGQRLTDFNVADDLARDATNLNTPDLFPGSAGPYLQGVRDKMNPRTAAFYNIFANRRRSGNPNWLLDAGDRAATASDSWNRIGTYLTAVRKGYTPEAAKSMADLTQVVYRPEAFTSFERDFVKRLMPFYSYTKGISPLVAGDLVNRPAGLMGQSVRAVNRGGAPSEDQFTPEYLRQSASIPVDPDSFLGSLVGVKTPGVQRFLTNIDLPHESLLNLFTPGVGNTFSQRLSDSLMKTGSNILGQATPAFKGPLESILNRQFYSGRQLSDLYSMLEHDLGSLSPALGQYGRMAEQIGVNLPGGSRLLGLVRQIRDERISPSERAAKLLFNTLTGMKFQDVDQDKTLRLAARTTLNQLLDAAPGVSTYENLFIKPEELARLSDTEQRQYLLYRVLQSEAAKRAREKKKAADDPLSVLGVQYP